MAKKDDLIEICQEAGIEPTSTGLRGKAVDVRTKVIKRRTPWFAIGTIMVALASTWTLKYDANTRCLLEAQCRNYDVAQHSDEEKLLSTVIFITSVAANNYTLPSDWNPANNIIECIGAGGNGNAGQATNLNGKAGGGGGAYSAIVNAGYSPNELCPCQVGDGPGGTTGATGEDTWFYSATDVMAKGGAGPGTTGVTGGQGGQASAGFGTTKYNGGNGGTNTQGNSRQGAGGGGGAAGPDGAGVNGDNGTASSGGAGGAGGAGNANTNGGGAGGASTTYPTAANTGSAGTTWEGTHGPGGGGSGGGGRSSGSPAAAGGFGGLYGGGGGGGGGPTGTFGRGAQGLIILTYTAAVGGGDGPLFRIFTIGA